MIERLAWLLIFIGLCFSLYFSYKFYDQSSQMEDMPDLLNKNLSTKNQGLEYILRDNDYQKNDQLVDPSTEKDFNLIDLDLKECEYAGFIFFPKLGKRVRYVWGTSERCLSKGLGMMDKDILAYPGELGRCIISGHRDTNFRIARLLEIGDKFFVTFIKKPNKFFIYKFEYSKIVDKNATSEVRSSPDHELCLTTCYPFSFIGNAPKRYLMCGPLIEVRDIPDDEWDEYWKF